MTYWGLSDDGAWLGPPAGLVRADGTPSQHTRHEALRRLVRGDWWLSPTTVRTDLSGRLRLRVFGGEYRMTAGNVSVRLTV